MAPETASGLYEIFVRLLTGYSRQDVNIRTAAGDAPYPELYKASMSTLGYYKALSKLMAKVGVRDFSVQVSRVRLARMRVRLTRARRTICSNPSRRA